jgi:hypothetical protein
VHARRTVAVLIAPVIIVALASSTSATARSAAPGVSASGATPGTRSSPEIPAVVVGPRSPCSTGSSCSTNWSGYVERGTTFSGITAHWIVPAVAPSVPAQHSSTWIGIDGSGNSSLIQTGTGQYTVGGHTYYDAWWEILPAVQTTIAKVSPGDSMAASVIEDAPGTWTITMDDQTSGLHFSRTTAYSGPAASAEWIEEAPHIDGKLSTLADFGSVRLSDIGATAVGDPTITAIQMTDASPAVVAYPGAIADQAFTVTYGSPPPDPVPSPTPPGPAPGPSPSPPATPSGYWLVGGDGGIFTYGSASFFGSTGSLTLQRPVVGMAPTSDLGGYWLAGSDGGAFAFGDAGYFGSVPGLGIAPAGTAGPGRRLNAPIVGIAPSGDGGGYLMVGSDGGVFAFGDATFEGSCPSIGGCSGPVVAVVPDGDGGGYWLVTATGNVYSFGDALYHGGPGPRSSPVVDAAATPDGQGYWILQGDGAVTTYGDAVPFGSLAGAGGADPATGIVPTADGAGYWIATAQGGITPYGDATSDGSMAGHHLNAPIVGAAGW